jgi:hypothetical protein
MGRVRYFVVVSYQPISQAELARFVAAEPDFDTRWRLVVQFLKEYHREPAGARQRLLADAPGPTGDERWDVLQIDEVARLAEALAGVRTAPRCYASSPKRSASQPGTAST